MKPGDKFYSTFTGRTYKFVEVTDEGTTYIGRRLEDSDGESIPPGMYRVPARFVARLNEQAAD
jgi:hypothetical protein